MVHRAITKHLQCEKMKWKSIPICWLPHVASADMTQALPASWGPAPTHVIMTENSIVTNVSPLGFILGDEGSGACLGKLLVGDILKNQMTPELKEKFLKQFDLTPADIIDRVYRKPFPNRFLASLSPFLAQNLDEPCVRALVLRQLSRHSSNAMSCNMKTISINKVHFIGSVAFYYKEVSGRSCHKKWVSNWVQSSRAPWKDSSNITTESDIIVNSK